MTTTRSSAHRHVAHTYDRLATDYDQRWRRYIDATLEAVVEVAPLASAHRVLDVACGTGELERQLLRRRPGLHVTGIDMSSGMLGQARRKHAARQIDWLRGDVRHLPLADASFDVCICANSFHYFREPKARLGELRRVLRPSGSLVLVDWCDDYVMCKLCSVWLRVVNPAFYGTYSLRQCSKLIEQAGFRTTIAERFRINWLWGLMRIVAERPHESPAQCGHH